MSKKLENIDELFQTKLSELSDDDLPMNDVLIWDKIEHKLDKKPRLVALWWQIGVAACLVISLFLGWRVSRQDPKITVNSVKPLIKKEVIPVNEIVVEKKEALKPRKMQHKKVLKIDLQTIQNEKTVALKTPDLVFEDIRFTPQIDSSSLTAKSKRLRVIHVDDINKRPIEILKENKSIYVQFNPKGADYQDTPPNKAIIIPLKSSKN
ncbi:MAG: hypothetical protein ACK4NY_17025 [Spirosomataceae bacterium]